MGIYILKKCPRMSYPDFVIITIEVKLKNETCQYAKFSLKIFPEKASSLLIGGGAFVLQKEVDYVGN